MIHGAASLPVTSGHSEPKLAARDARRELVNMAEGVRHADIATPGSIVSRAGGGHVERVGQ